MTFIDENTINQYNNHIVYDIYNATDCWLVGLQNRDFCHGFQHGLVVRTEYITYMTELIDWMCFRK